jgi:hypothetical protein
VIELPEVNAAAAPRSYFFSSPTRPILLISSAGRPIFSAISWIPRVRRLVAFEPAEKLGRHAAVASCFARRAKQLCDFGLMSPQTPLRPTHWRPQKI